MGNAVVINILEFHVRVSERGISRLHCSSCRNTLVKKTQLVLTEPANVHKNVQEMKTAVCVILQKAPYD